MKRLTMILLMLLAPGSISAIEVGTSHRQGNSVVFNVGCIAFDFKKLSKTWPKGSSTIGELVFLLAASKRDLTPGEIQRCNSRWRVAPIPGMDSRPYYTLSGGIIKQKIMIGSVFVGGDCSQATDSYHVKIPGTETYWRNVSIGGMNGYVTICESK